MVVVVDVVVVVVEVGVVDDVVVVMNVDVVLVVVVVSVVSVGSLPKDYPCLIFLCVFYFYLNILAFLNA